MAEVTNRAGIGQDGFAQIQDEATFGTPATGSEIDIPIKEGTDFTAYPERIESMYTSRGRLKPDPQQGRILINGQIVMDGWPTLLGGFLKRTFGAASSSDNGDGSYNHVWFIPKTGFNVGRSFTWTQAKGNCLSDRLDGCTITAFTINQDNQGNQEWTFEYVGKGYTEDVARETTFTFPSSADDPPFNFGHAIISATPSGGDQVTLCADNFSISVDLNYNKERFKMCSTLNGAEISQPVFNGPPIVTLNMNVDADQYVQEYARSFTQWDIVFTYSHSTSAAGGQNHYLILEFPGSLLDPATDIPHGNEYLNMDLTFNCEYGGTTTSSGTDEYMAEFLLTDETAAYA